MSELQSEVEKLIQKWKEKEEKIHFLEDANQHMLELGKNVDETRCKAMTVAESILSKSIAFIENEQKEAKFFAKLLPDIKFDQNESTAGIILPKFTSNDLTTVDIKKDNEDKMWDARLNECNVMSTELQKYLKRSWKI